MTMPMDQQGVRALLTSNQHHALRDRAVACETPAVWKHLSALSAHLTQAGTNSTQRASHLCEHLLTALADPFRERMAH